MADVPSLSMNMASASGLAIVSASAVVPASASGSGPAKSAIQELIISTLGIPVHLTDRSIKAKADIRMAYAKYLALLDASKSMSKMVTSGTWTHKVATNDDIIEIFMSKSAYFQNHSKVFSMVHRYPPMQKWLGNGDDAPPDHNVWGYQKHTFENLKEILIAHPIPLPPAGTNDKGKSRDISSSPDMSPPFVEKRKKVVVVAKVVKKQGKKKMGESDKKGRKDGGVKKASTSKTHRV